MARRTAPRSDIPVTSAFAVSVGPSGTDIATQEITEFDTFALTFNMSDGDMVKFTTAGWTPEARQTDELATDVYLEGLVQQRFRVTSIDQEWDESGNDVVTVTALSYKRLLAARQIQPGGLMFTGVDQGDIVWGLIAHTQATVGGDWRITKGATTTGVTRDRTYIEGDNIGDLATKLQQVIDGLWWDVDYDLTLIAAMPSAFGLAPTPLQHGANVRRMKRASAAARFANAVYVDGNQDKTTPVWREAPGLAADPRGRWETAIGYPTVEVQTTLEEHADGALEDAQTPLATWTASIEPTRWLTDTLLLPGDFAVLVIPPSTVAPINPVARKVVVQVVEVTFAITADGAVTVDMALTETTQAAP